MPPFSPSDGARLRETISALVEQHRLPGISVGVASGDGLVFSEACGYADIESKRPMSPHLRQRIGAVTGLRFPQLVDMCRNDSLQPWA